MAFTSGAVWEIRTTGDDTNFGGGFDTGVSGFPTDLATTTGTNSAPVVSSASYNFVAGDVGAWVFIKSGTNWIPGWYKITSVASNKATLNAAIGAGVKYVNSMPMDLNISAGVATQATPGGNATWGIDYSQRDSQQFASSTLAIGNPTTTNLTDGTNTIGKNWVGNIVNIQAGGGFNGGRFVVTSTSGTTATVDTSLGTAGSTGGTGKLGGALASPGLTASLKALAGQSVFIKSGTYTITSASTNISGGCVSDAVGGEGRWEGYSSVRGDMLGAPTLLASGISTATLFTITGAAAASGWVRNLMADGASLTSIRGFSLARRDFTLDTLTALNCTNDGINISATMLGINLRANNTTGGTAGITHTGANSELFGCVASSGSVSGFFTSNVCSFHRCIAYNNSGTSDGFITGASVMFSNCVSYGNGRDGFRHTVGGGAEVVYINCIAEGNTGVAFNPTSTGKTSIINCATYNNSGTVVTTANIIQRGSVTGTSTFFTNAGSGDFSLNNSSTGGQLARSAGIDGVFPGGLSTGYLDIGAVQARWPMMPLGISGVMG